MIDVQHERPISLKEAAGILNCCVGTVRTYATRGYRGRQLETVRIGGRIFTSMSAIRRFIGQQIEPQPLLIQKEGVKALLKGLGIEV